MCFTYPFAGSFIHSTTIARAILRQQDIIHALETLVFLWRGRENQSYSTTG